MLPEENPMRQENMRFGEDITQLGVEVEQSIERSMGVGYNPFDVVRRKFEGFVEEPGRRFREESGIPRFSDRIRSFRETPNTIPLLSDREISGAVRAIDSMRYSNGSSRVVDRLSGGLQRAAGIMSSGLDARGGGADPGYLPETYPSRAISTQLTVFERKSDPQQVQRLVEAVENLRRTLGPTVISRVTVKYATVVEGGATREIPVGVTVAVRNFTDSFIDSNLMTRGVSPNTRREHTFNLTADRMGGVIDTDSNRYINGAAFSNVGLSGQLMKGQQITRGIETAVGLIATYARSSFHEAKHGVVDTAFNAMVARGDYTALGRVIGRMYQQRVYGIERSLGASFGEVAKGAAGGELKESLKGLLKEIAATPDSVMSAPEISNQVDKVLSERGASRKQLESELYKRRLGTLERVFQPVFKQIDIGGNLEDALQKSYKDLAQVLQSSSTEVRLNQDDVLSVDVFKDLKLAALGESPYGRNYYTMLKGNASSSILESLMAPFMQPHEASYSAGQLRARLGFYANPEANGPKSFYDYVYGNGIYYLTPEAYRHGSLGTAPGYFQKPIAATAAAGRLGEKVKEVAMFFENKTLFTTSPQLGLTTVNKISETLSREKYRGAEELRAAIRTTLGLGEDEESDKDVIFLMPFKKPEQMSQRLKNFTGTRPARELNKAFRSALESLNLDALRRFVRRDQFGFREFDFGDVLAGNINTALPAEQFEYALGLRQQLTNEVTAEGFTGEALLEEVSYRLTKTLRREDISPFATRGLIGGRNERRVLVAFGLNEMSDFYYANSGYDASYGDLHLTRVKVKEITKTFGEGGVVYEQNPNAQIQKELLRKVFTVGSTLYYNPIDLGMESKTAKVLQGIFQNEARLVSANSSAMGVEETNGYRLAAQSVRNAFDFIDKLEYSADGVLTRVGLKPGLYSMSDKGVLYRSAELVDSVLRIGLKTEQEYPGGPMLQRYFGVKIPGEVRKDQNAISVVASDINDRGEVAFAITTRDSAGVRPGVDFTKGPAAFIRSDVFNQFDERYGGRGYFARDVMGDQIFGLMSASAFKGYNYESGLSALRDPASRARLLNLSSTDTAVFLSLMFMGDGDGEGQRLRRAVKGYLGTTAPTESKRLLRLLEYNGNFGASLNAFKNLVIGATPIVRLAGSAEVERGDKLTRPLYQIQRRLTEAFESGRGIEEFAEDVRYLLRSATEDTRSMEVLRRVDGERVAFRQFNESDPYVRAAAVLSDVLITMEQAVNYRGMEGKSLLSLNLKKDGRISGADFLRRGVGERMSILNMAYRSGITLPSDRSVENLIQRMSRGENLEADRDFQQLELGLVNLYYQSQAAPLIQRSIKYLPSRLMVAAGSEDAVGLEYHYSLNMSSRALAGLRGTGLDAEGLTEAQAAYSIIVSYGNALSFRRLKIDSAFKERQASKDLASVMRVYSPLLSSLRNFGASQNRSMLEEITESLVRGDRNTFAQMIQQANVMKQLVASPYENEERFGLLRRTTNLVNYFDQSRLRNRGAAAGGGSTNFNLETGRYVLFDIETYDLLNQGYRDGDVRRYPKHLAELAYMVVENGKIVERKPFLIRPSSDIRPEDMPEKFRGLDYSQSVTSEEAIRGFLQAAAGADYIVGHNIERFDLPTIGSMIERMGLRGAGIDAFNEKLRGRQFIDTLSDMNKGRAKEIYRNSSFTLGSMYDAVEKQKAREEISRLRAAGNLSRAAELEKKLLSTFNYDAHRALADVEANLSVFKDLAQRGLFGKDVESGEVVKPFQGRLNYFAYSEDASNLYRMKLADEVLSLAKKSKGRSLVYEYENLRSSGGLDEILGRFDSSDRGRAAGDIRAAIDLVTDRGGYYKLRGKVGRQREQLLSLMIENDRKLENKVAESLERPAGQFIDVMKEQAGILERYIRYGDSGNKAGAESLLREIKETRAYVFPTIEAVEDRMSGRTMLRGYSTQEKVEILGLDVLNAIPKEFKGHVSEIVQSQQSLRMLEEDHRAIVQKISRGGAYEATEQEVAVIQEFNKLISANRQQMEDLGGSVLKQRAYGEKIKYPGASFIALASPLLDIEEMAFGERVTNRDFTSTANATGAEFSAESRRLKRAERLRERIEGLEDRGLKFSVFDEEGRVFRDNTIYDEAFEKYITGQLEESESLRFYQMVNKAVRQSVNGKQIVTNPERFANMSSHMLDDRYIEAATQVQEFVGGRLSSLREEEAQLTRELSTIRKFDTVDSGLRGMAMRAGGPHAGSSPVDQFAVGKTLESTVVERGEKEDTYLQISKERNQTALFLSMFGRFGVQGGDFDGDAYQLIFGFKDLEKKYLSALEQRNELKDTQRRIEVELGSVRDDSYRAYRQAELNELQGQLVEQNRILGDIEQRLPERLKDLEDLRVRAMKGVRRHTAAYFGAPIELFSEEAGLFSQREILDMIEQPRGILGAMDNYSKNPALNNDAIVRMFHHVNQQTGFQQALQLSSGEEGLTRLRGVVESALASGEFESISGDQKQRVASIIEQNLDSFREISSQSIVDTTSRLHKFTELAAEQSGFFSVINEFSGMVTAAAGLSMGRTTFEAMQTVIGSQGTSLIGEAYNAITTLGPQALMSRAFAEMLNEGLGTRSVAVDSSGLERHGQIADFDSRLASSLDMFGDSQAKTLVGSIFDPSNREQLVRTAIGRAEDITGKLAVIQQVIRDSLKLKEAGGLLTAVRSVAGGESFERRLEGAEDEATRFQLLRNFISQESGASLADLDQGGPFMSEAPRSSINMFGALLLISDYVKADPAKGRLAFDEMISSRGQERYQVLRERQQYYQAQLEGLNEGDPRRTFIERMATDSEFLVRRTALDLMNAVVAEKQVDTMLQKRNAVEFSRRIREGYIGALAGFDGENYNALRQALGNPGAGVIPSVAKAYDITAEDIEQARSGGGFRDIFSLEEINRVSLASGGGEIGSEDLGKYQFERARRVEYQANIARSRSTGMTEQDLLTMQRTLQGARAMRFDTAHTALDFKEFIAADAANLEAFRMYSRREHLGSLDEFRMLQLQIASEYAGAIDQVTQRLEKRYGSLSSAMQQEEVSRAYSSMVGMSGLFNQMEVGGKRLLDYGDETIRSVEEMVSLAMSRSGEGRSSLFGEMANRFAGMKMMEENHQMYRRFLNEGGNPYSDEALGYTRDLEEFQQKQAMDREARMRGEESRFTLNFLEERGQLERARQQEESFKIRDFESVLEQKESEKRSLSFSSALSIIAGPAAIAAITAGGTLDENLMSRSLDVVQAFAAMDDLHREQTGAGAGAGTQRGFSSAAMFQVARLNTQMRSEESAILGGLRGALGEVFYGGLNNMTYQMLGADKVKPNKLASGVMTGLAEVGAAAIGLAATRLMTKTKYGPREETYKDYVQQAVSKIAEQAQLYIQAAMAAQADPDIDIEGGEEEVSYEFNREVTPNEYEEKIQTGWLDIEIEDYTGDSMDFDYATA